MHCKSRWPREIVRDLELPSIGWLLFLPDSSPNDWTATSPTVVTFATRLLTESLIHRSTSKVYFVNVALTAFSENRLHDHIRILAIEPELVVGKRPASVLEH